MAGAEDRGRRIQSLKLLRKPSDRLGPRPIAVGEDDAVGCREEPLKLRIDRNLIIRRHRRRIPSGANPPRRLGQGQCTGHASEGAEAKERAQLGLVGKRLEEEAGCFGIVCGEDDVAGAWLALLEPGRDLFGIPGAGGVVDDGRVLGVRAPAERIEKRRDTAAFPANNQRNLNRVHHRAM